MIVSRLSSRMLVPLVAIAVSGGPEYKPTAAEVQVLAPIEHDLAAAKAGYDTVMATDVPAFNKQMAGKVTIK